MIYDQPYMRQTPSEHAHGDKVSMVTMLLVITIGVYILQHVLNVSFPSDDRSGNHFFNRWFALNSKHFKDLKVWTVLSYGFLHSTQGFLHILGNMVGLFFSGEGH